MARPNFWDNDHPLASQAQELYAKLVPDVGNCPTLQGELLRAANKIAYDWYNNGWGCNNWSGAVAFIRALFGKLPNQPPEQKQARLLRALSEADQYSTGASTDFLTDASAIDIVTDIEEIIVQAILDNPEPIVNTCDMYDFQRSESPRFGSVSY